MATHVQDPTKIRNDATAFETPFQGFSTRHERNESVRGLLFPRTNNS